MLGDDVRDVVSAQAGDRHAGQHQRLRIDFAVDGKGPDLAEGRGADRCRRENGLVQILAGPRVVVVIGHDVHAGADRQQRAGLRHEHEAEEGHQHS